MPPVILPIPILFLHADVEAGGKDALRQHAGDTDIVQLVLVDAAPADALNRDRRNHLIVRTAIRGDATIRRSVQAVAYPIVLCGIRLVAGRRYPFVRHVFIDLVCGKFIGLPSANDRQKLAERFRARGVGLPSATAIAVLGRALRPRIHERIGWIRTICTRKAIRRIRQHVGVCHAMPATPPRIFDIG